MVLASGDPGRAIQEGLWAYSRESRQGNLRRALGTQQREQAGQSEESSGHTTVLGLHRFWQQMASTEMDLQSGKKRGFQRLETAQTIRNYMFQKFQDPGTNTLSILN